MPQRQKGSSHHHQINDSTSPEEVAGDTFGSVYEYIKMLMEQEDEEEEDGGDLAHAQRTLQYSSVLQATEKQFHDALINTRNDSNAPLQIRSTPDPCSTSYRVSDPETGNQATTSSRADSRRPMARTREDNAAPDEPRNKQFAPCSDESIEMLEKYDKYLLCPKMNPGFYDDVSSSSDDNNDAEASNNAEEEDDPNKLYRKSTEVKRGRPKGSKKNARQREVIDLMGLLGRCAQAISDFDTKASSELLRQIRQHSSPHRGPDERLAHYFANALEARMSNTGPDLYRSFALRRISASSFLRSYQSYVSACPFKRMSNIFANKTIGRNTRDATTLHIIDFGILNGFQWPCIIQGLSLRPDGPPKLKITGIDFPQPGLRPDERVRQTGARLREYSKRFNVPFEYNAVAKKWEEIELSDLRLEPGETVVVNCLYQMRLVPDESMSPNGSGSPRDDVLRFIRRAIRPKLFVHGVVSGSYNASFFNTRFREAVHHYSSFFDMLECTLPRGDEDRLVYEGDVFGRDLLNVVACEGLERVERPESYKQWQARNRRAGFEQCGLDREVFREMKVKVKRDYHSCFLLDEDCEWMIQGWKGRVLYALSCWKPSEDR